MSLAYGIEGSAVELLLDGEAKSVPHSSMDGVRAPELSSSEPKSAESDFMQIHTALRFLRRTLVFDGPASAKARPLFSTCSASCGSTNRRNLRKSFSEDLAIAGADAPFSSFKLPGIFAWEVNEGLDDDDAAAAAVSLDAAKPATSLAFEEVRKRILPKPELYAMHLDIAFPRRYNLRSSDHGVCQVTRSFIFAGGLGEPTDP